MKMKIVDSNNDEIKLDIRVRTGLVHTDIGSVSAISNPDVDYDDEVQAPVLYPPKITVTFVDGSDEVFTSSQKPPPSPWHEYPDGFDWQHGTYVCEDLEVVK